MNQSFSQELFNKMPVIGIFRGFPASQMEEMAGIYVKAGLTTMEITMNTMDAAQTIASLVKAMGGTLNVGAGTVCSVDDLDQALDAGAQFIVTPIIDEAVIKKCLALKIPIFPGAYTPTEIYRAWSLGATMVKVFPAGKLGPDYIKEVLAPLNQIQLLPTGGISLDNIRAFIKAGAKGFGIGSSLVPKHMVENGEWDALYDHLIKFVNQYKAFLNED